MTAVADAPRRRQKCRTQRLCVVRGCNAAWVTDPGAASPSPQARDGAIGLLNSRPIFGDIVETAA